MLEDNHLDVKENKEINSSQAPRYETRPHKSSLEKDYFGVRYRPPSHPHQKLNQYLTLVDNTLGISFILYQLSYILKSEYKVKQISKFLLATKLMFNEDRQKYNFKV